jgi:mannan endo-1,4-beta-mannosidase
MRMLGRAALLLSAALLAAPAAAREPAPVDRQATRETRNLFANMLAASRRHVMFGHQNTLAYGYRWRGEPNRSDVKDVTGSFPAVYGWDVADIFRRGRPDEADPEGAAQLRAYVRQARARGGVSTFSWHMPNPVNDTDAWNVTPAVDRIVPGGPLHADYKAKLDVVADFFLSLKDARGRPIPVWFRPFHEHTGSWFWWGKGNASAADFVRLWRFTVEYLRDTRGVHNLLWAYSTDTFDSEAQFFEFYPGDGYADMLGFDDYHSIKTVETRPLFVRRMGDVVRWARARGKLAALTETGVEALPDPNWWTGVLLPALKAPEARGISYVLVWRNANPAYDRKDHFYAPYPGQASAADFVKFRRDPMIWFEPDLPDLYKRRRR